MITRDITPSLKAAAKAFPVVSVVGPRQSGKTTLVRKIFSKHTYISLEDLDIRRLANQDPRGFLEKYSGDHGLILDEVQHTPDLLSYIQTIVDEEKQMGYFILTGSQNLLLNEAISQSLAGRMAILTLMPLSTNELKKADKLPNTIEEVVFKGGYPRIYADHITPTQLYPNYIRSYVERDVRLLKNIGDLNTFQRFLQLCAGRTGQLLNLSSLGNDCGIDSKTAKAWISILEATYTIILLYPYYKNYGKRVIKAPKLYFVDTGIACSLLGIKSPEDVAHHYLRGGLVESFIISDFYKQFYNNDERPSLYFWRDHAGNEVDVIVENALKATPIEIKASKTIVDSFLRTVDYWKKLTDSTNESYLVYAGNRSQQYKRTQIVSWKASGDLISKIQG